MFIKPSESGSKTQGLLLIYTGQTRASLGFAKAHHHATSSAPTDTVLTFADFLDPT